MLVRVEALPSGLVYIVSEFVWNSCIFFYLLWTDLYVTYAKSDLPAEILSIVLKLKTLNQIIKGKWDSSANSPFCSFRLATVTLKKKNAV